MLSKKSTVSSALIVCIVLILIAAGPIGARKPAARIQVQDSALASKKEEREFEDLIPKHLSLRVKIKKEKEESFKDLKNEHWARDFELELTNTGDKDIYFLGLNLILPETKASDGRSLSFPIHYGRAELSNFEIRADGEDVPIRPGETYVLRIVENQVIAHETLNRELHRPLPKRVVLHFNFLSFGDGTGSMGYEGTFFLGRQGNPSLSKC